MDERTDEELIAAYKGGEEAAFSVVVDRYLRPIYSFVIRLIGNEHEAEDVTQDIFLKIWKYRNSYTSETSRFKTWALRIARNTSIDYLRKKKHVPISVFDNGSGGNTITDTLTDNSPLPEEVFADKENIELLSKAVVELSPQHKEILTLHYTNHLTFEEIAQVLEEPHNTVKSRHYRALVALRKVYATYAPERYI